ncbi:MAG: hypothetical protein K2L53_00955 [Clostridia bacterium]|nr:hypothetical protein [Clostridia bacterium]
MLKDTLFQFFAFMSQDKIEFDERVCRKQHEELKKCKKELLNAIEKDSELKKLYHNLELAIEELHGNIIGKYYEEGFKCGAKLVLEICGYELKDKQ